MSSVVEDLGPLPYSSKVEAMAGYGLSAADIARVLDISEQELKTSYERQRKPPVRTATTSDCQRA
jgi:hypothetical protein